MAWCLESLRMQDNQQEQKEEERRPITKGKRWRQPAREEKGGEGMEVEEEKKREERGRREQKWRGGGRRGATSRLESKEVEGGRGGGRWGRSEETTSRFDGAAALWMLEQGDARAHSESRGSTSQHIITADTHGNTHCGCINRQAHILSLSSYYFVTGVC